MSNTTTPHTTFSGPPPVQLGTVLDVPAAADVLPSTLDADSLLAYCTSRLNALDTQINQRFAEQTNRTNNGKALAKAIADLRTFTGGVTEHAGGQTQAKDANGKLMFDANMKPIMVDHEYAGNHQTLGDNLIADYNATSDPEQKSAIAGMYAEVTGTSITDLSTDASGHPTGPAKLNPDNIKGISETAWNAQVDTLKTMADNSSKDNELNMISLQAMVSQRQLAIQLTTGMMQAMNEGAKGVVANIRG